QLTAGRVVALSSVDDLPAEAARDRETYRHYGVKTGLSIPLSTGGGPSVGYLSFNDMKAERLWPEALVTRLHLVAQIFANALVRKQADRALRESEERLSLAADSAGAGMWGLDLDGGHLWVTEKGKELFDLSADEVVTFDRIMNLIHPDDRELVQQAVHSVVESGKEGSVEYRVMRADGSVRWIASRGRVCCDKSGKPDHLMGVSVDVTDRKRMEQELQSRLSEIEELRQQLERENIYLRQEVEHFEQGDIIGSSAALMNVLALAEQVAPTDSTVLLLGETGTGKELIARAIHNHSKRKGHVMVKVDCASLPAALIESELFGREKGAYTGALTRQAGRFEVAEGSTIFLDEIAEIPLELQAKLLRVLQDGEFERLGSPRKITVDVRVIAATNRDLAEAVKKGAFREDLFYRLNVFPIRVPPLRERPEDIPLLVQAFVNEFSGKMGKKIRTVPRGSIGALQRYGWPGNIRELRNLIEQAVIISDSEILKINAPLQAGSSRLAFLTMEEAEYLHIVQTLEKTGWRIKGAHGAAALLGLKPSTLYSRMSKLNIPTRREKDGMTT
ncbi:MAG TPA: sigma 54-interacting transcriptional regulator, partial [Dissulfurispiraceae bacterium]|nr:sigma 54-interacting transcriptional regulator [Dissulfurispiraceae bacterium]